MPSKDATKFGQVEIVSPTRAIGYVSSTMPNIQYPQWNKIAIATYDQFIRNQGIS